MSSVKRIDDQPNSCEGCYHLGSYNIEDELGYYCQISYEEYTTPDNYYVLACRIVPDPLHSPSWCKRWED